MAYYLHISVTVNFENQPRYAACMEEFIPFMAKNGWELVLGLRPFTGSLTEIIHIWKMDTLEDYNRGIAAVAAHRHELPYIDEFHHLVDAEVITMKVAQPYSQ